MQIEENSIFSSKTKYTSNNDLKSINTNLSHSCDSGVNWVEEKPPIISLNIELAQDFSKHMKKTQETQQLMWFGQTQSTFMRRGLRDTHYNHGLQ